MIVSCDLSHVCGTGIIVHVLDLISSHVNCCSSAALCSCSLSLSGLTVHHHAHHQLGVGVGVGGVGGIGPGLSHHCAIKLIIHVVTRFFTTALSS